MAGQTISIRVTADVDQMVAALTKAGQSVDRFAKRSNNGFMAVAKNVLGLAGLPASPADLAVAASRAMLGFGVETARAAMQAEQAIRGIDVVFGEAADSVKKFGETSAVAYGLSRREAAQVVAPIGALLKGLGFTEDQAAKSAIQISKLGADLSAAFPTAGGPAHAVQALGAALRGEYDPAERFGIGLSETTVKAKMLSMGFNVLTGQVNLNERAQAVLALMMERTNAIQGQFARNADTTAGKVAILSARFDDLKVSIGAALLDGLGDNVDNVDRSMSSIGGFFTGMSEGVGRALGTMARDIDKVLTKLYELDEASAKSPKTAEERAKNAGRAFWLTFVDSFTGTTASRARQAVLDWRDQDRDGFWQEFLFGKRNGGLEDPSKMLDEFYRPMYEKNPFTGEWVKEFYRNAPSATGMLPETGDFAALAEFGTAMEDMGKKAKLSSEDLDKVAKSVRGVVDAADEGRRATLDFEEAIDELPEKVTAIAEAEAEFGQDSKEYRDAVRDLERAHLDLADAAEDVAVAYAEETIARRESVGVQQTEKDRLSEIISELINLKNNTKDPTALKAINDRIAAYEREKALIEDAALAAQDYKNKASWMKTPTTFSPEYGIGTVPQAELADGGPVRAGSTYLVGERGPELFTANKSGMIVPNEALGGGVTINVGHYYGPPDQFVSDMSEALRRLEAARR